MDQVLRAAHLLVALLVLVAVIAVFISPAVDLPDTALRAFQAAVLLLLVIVVTACCCLLQQEPAPAPVVTVSNVAAYDSLPRFAALFCNFLC